MSAIEQNNKSMKAKKHTKIVATVSDKRCEVDFIKSLYKAGMNVIRLNTAHLDFDGVTKIIIVVR